MLSVKKPADRMIGGKTMNQEYRFKDYEERPDKDEIEKVDVCRKYACAIANLYTSYSLGRFGFYASL